MATLRSLSRNLNPYAFAPRSLPPWPAYLLPRYLPRSSPIAYGMLSPVASRERASFGARDESSKLAYHRSMSAAVVKSPPAPYVSYRYGLGLHAELRAWRYAEARGQTLFSR